MSDYLIMKAVEHAKLPAKFRKQYPDTNALLDAGWWVQDKYDGCMGIAMMTTHREDCKMLSRTGEDYTPSCGHILDELHEAKTALVGYPTLLEDFIVIGEVWQPGWEAPFPAISGKFRRRAASPELRFVANDILPPGFNTPEEYRIRFATLCELLPAMDGVKVTVANTRQSWPANVERLAIQLRGWGGYDGAIMRDPNAGYTVGTVKAGEIVKVKPVMSLDLEVVDVLTAAGEKTGRPVYTIVVTHNGVASTVGSGVPHAWNEVPGPGQIAEIECLGITAEGKLREPRFKGARFDKVKPD